MPLEDFIPVIDDRRYDDIMREIRTRIARYTPEWKPVWTDVNDSDPGVTMVQVFAWLSEMLLYRMARVPDLNYLKFLQLLGIELAPAEPAVTEIAFPVKTSFAKPYVIVPERTQVAAESDDGELLIFETSETLKAFRASIRAILVHDGYHYTDVTTDNTDPEITFQPFGSIANSGNSLMIGFTGELPPREELNLMVWRDTGTSPVNTFDCAYGNMPVYSPANLSWEYWNGAEWRTLSLLKDGTAAFTETGHIYLKTPAAGSMQPASFGTGGDKSYWIRCFIKESGYENVPKVVRLAMNTVAAVQARTVYDEILGGSNGTPNQQFSLEKAPVLNGTLTLEIDEGDGPVTWTCVDDFSGSGINDKHFLLNRTTGEVRFGDGINGAIPVGNVNNLRANVIAREYRYGGGKKGNVGAGTAVTVLTPLAGIDDNKVSNFMAAHDGRDEETLREAKLRAPGELKNKNRAVTAEDFENMAKKASNIKRAKALPLYHPDFPDVKIPGAVTVVVVPDIDTEMPVPSESTLKSVCAYLNKFRLLTTELYVVKPRYVKISIETEIIVAANADLAQVNEAVLANLLEYFHPLKGGETGDGWPFGGTVYFSRVYQRIFSVSGVERIEKVIISRDGEDIDACGNAAIPDGGLVYSTDHAIHATYETEA